jgi:DNA polymerase I
MPCFEYKFLKKDGICMNQRWVEDSMVMAFLKEPAQKMGLKAAATRWVDKRAAFGQKLLGQVMAAGGWDWATIPIDHPAYWQYGVLDTCLESLLASALAPEILGVDRYRRAYELELGVIACLRDAEIAGLKTDPVYRARASAQLRADLDRLRLDIPASVKNPNSDAQVRNYLLDLGAPLVVLTEHGALSVDKDVLRYLAPKYPIAAVFEEFRSKSRMLSNYFEKMDDLAVDDVLHASTRPVGARTRRMSVTDPPLQTLPRGRLVRDAIVAREGQAIVAADFMGMELRALASIAPEQNMLDAFNRGEDLHAFVARALYGDDFSKPQRTICKNGNFSKVYGAGVEKFAVTAGIDVGEAKSFLEKYDQMFPGVRTFMEKTTHEVFVSAGHKRRGWGWVELIDGCHIPVEADKAYKGVNTKIQGSCAIVLKEKIVELDNAGLGDFFRLAVHDELLYECPLDLRAEVKHILEQVMPDRENFKGVVLEVEADAFDRWGAHYRHDFEPYLPTEEPAWMNSSG